MGTRQTYHRVLVRACLIAGDETELARRLKVPVTSVVDWLLHGDPCPPEVFLRAVDLVVMGKDESLESPGALLGKIKARHRHTPRAKR